MATQPEHKHLAANLARFAFCKEDDTLQGAMDTLRRLHAPNGDDH